MGRAPRSSVVNAGNTGTGGGRDGVSRYHCNLKLLYLLYAAYQVDVVYVLTGQSTQPQPTYPPVVRSSERPSEAK